MMSVMASEPPADTTGNPVNLADVEARNPATALGQYPGPIHLPVRQGKNRGLRLMVVLAGAMRLRVRRAFYRSVGAILEEYKPA